MAALTTILGALSLGLGVTGAVSQQRQQADARRSVAAAQAAQETAAREAAALRTTKTKANTRIKVGSVDTGLVRSDADERRNNSVMSTGSTVGGVSASRIGGL